MPGFTAAKAVWMQRHEPELFAKINKILLPKDFIRLQMTGEFCAEMSDGAGTLWMDVAQRCWSDELLGACGLNSNQMPRLIEGSEISGTLRRDIATSWGIEDTPVVAGGAGDNAAAACGLGVTASGDAFLSLGTSGVVFAVTDSFSPAPENGAHAFCHAIPETWHQMGVILAATDCLNWLAEITGQTVSALLHDIETSKTGPSPVLFHPYLSGEWTPHNDAEARGAFFGLSRAHDRREITRAVVEGVAFALADAVDVLTGNVVSSFDVNSPDNLVLKDDSLWITSWDHSIPDMVVCDNKLPCAMPFSVYRLGPDSLRAEQRWKFSHTVIGLATVAFPLNNRVWIGSARSNRIANFSVSK